MHTKGASVLRHFRSDTLLVWIHPHFPLAFMAFFVALLADDVADAALNLLRRQLEPAMAYKVIGTKLSAALLCCPGKTVGALPRADAVFQDELGMMVEDVANEAAEGTLDDLVALIGRSASNSAEVGVYIGMAQLLCGFVDDILSGLVNIFLTTAVAFCRICACEVGGRQPFEPVGNFPLFRKVSRDDLSRRSRVVQYGKGLRFALLVARQMIG